MTGAQETQKIKQDLKNGDLNNKVVILSFYKVVVDFLNENPGEFKKLIKIAKTIRKGLRDDYDFVAAITGREGCQPKGSKVMMADGTWKDIEKIKRGDLILSPQIDGTNIFSRVLTTTSWFSKKNYDVIELNRNRKKLYTCSDNHLIPFNYRYFPRKNGKRLAKDRYWGIKHYEAGNYYSLPGKRTKKNVTTITSPKISHFLNRKNCEIEPYTLGVFLGDGNFSGSSLAITLNSKDNSVIKEISKFYEVMNQYKRQNVNAISYRFSKIGELGKSLFKYGLHNKNSGTKFIPKDALYSDLEYRKRLLAGLIDSDGYLSREMSYSITTKSKEMAENILWLVYSLGGRGNIKKIKKGIKKINFIGEYYNISFYLRDMELPLQTERRIRKNKFFYLSSNRVSVDLIESKPQQVYGFSIDSPSKWYITDNFCVTHNSGKTTLEIILAILIDKKFDLKKQLSLLPSTGEIKRMFRAIRQYGVLGIDEAIKILHKQDWYNILQKIIIQMYATERYQNKCTLMAIPRFVDMNEQFRNHRVNCWFDVVDRGIAFVKVPIPVPYFQDPWLMSDNAKRYEWLLKTKKGSQITIEDMQRVEKKNPCYVDTIYFPDLPTQIKEIYIELRAEARKREQQINIEDLPKDKVRKALALQIVQDKEKGFKNKDLAAKYEMSDSLIKMLAKEGRLHIRKKKLEGKQEEEVNW